MYFIKKQEKESNKSLQMLDRFNELIHCVIASHYYVNLLQYDLFQNIT